MLWYISKLIDSVEEYHERRSFYSKLTGRVLFEIEETRDYYILSDGRKDYRCMIIGHTDTAFDVIKLLKEKSRKKHRFYLSVCIMSYDCCADIRRQARGDEIFLSMQEPLVVGRDLILGCAFLEKANTRLGFRATRSELNLYKTRQKGFSNKLDSSFINISELLAQTSKSTQISIGGELD